VYKGLTVCSAYRVSSEDFPSFMFSRYNQREVEFSGFALGFLVGLERGWNEIPLDAANEVDSEELRKDAKERASIVGEELVREFDHLAKRFYACSDGRFGSGPGDMQVGDTVVIFAGSPVPYILRPATDSSGNWRLVGWAYRFGVMLGEVYRQEDAVSMLEVFNII